LCKTAHPVSPSPGLPTGGSAGAASAPGAGRARTPPQPRCSGGSARAEGGCLGPVPGAAERVFVRWAPAPLSQLSGEPRDPAGRGPEGPSAPVAPAARSSLPSPGGLPPPRGSAPLRAPRCPPLPGMQRSAPAPGPAPGRGRAGKQEAARPICQALDSWLH